MVASKCRWTDFWVERWKLNMQLVNCMEKWILVGWMEGWKAG